MPEVDLSAHQTANLVIRLSGRAFMVRPPGALQGILLMKVVTIGWQAAFDPKNMSEQVFLQAIGEEELKRIGQDDFGVERLALGDTLQDMLDANIPKNDITMAARYAAFYWTFDKEVADKLMADDLAMKRGESLPPPTDTELPKL